MFVEMLNEAKDYLNKYSDGYTKYEFTKDVKVYMPYILGKIGKDGTFGFENNDFFTIKKGTVIEITSAPTEIGRNGYYGVEAISKNINSDAIRQLENMLSLPRDGKVLKEVGWFCEKHGDGYHFDLPVEYTWYSLQKIYEKDAKYIKLQKR